MKIRLLLVLTLLSASAMANDADSLKQKTLRYVFSINSSVLLCGGCRTESATVAMPSTVHGLQYKRLRVGGGIAYTSFGPMRAMPYFGTVSFDLYGKKRKDRGLFLEYSYGGAHAWVAPVMRTTYLKDVSGSGFEQFSVGYAFRYQKLRLAAQGGLQRLSLSRRYEYGELVLYPSGGEDLVVPRQREVFEYETNRFFLSISIGI